MVDNIKISPIVEYNFDIDLDSSINTFSMENKIKEKKKIIIVDKKKNGGTNTKLF